ncbi:MAG: TolC family protein [Bacteroidota bacterium]|nr:TolC family protein [Bacteroidota bacterium]
MKVKVLLFLFVFSLGLFSNRVSGQSSLVNLLNYALEHNREIRKSNLQIKEANYIRKEALGHGLPQVDGSGSYSKMMFEKFDIPSSLYLMIPPAYAPMIKELGSIDKVYSTSLGFQVTQLIYSQSYWIGLKTAQKTQELYTVLKTKNEEDVIDDVASTYYQTGSLMLQLQTLDKSLKNLREIYRIAELNYKSDFIKETDVSRLKVTITNLDVTRQTIKNGIDIQLNYLKALAGMPDDSLLKIDTNALLTDFERIKTNGDFKAENVPSYQVLLKQDEVYDQQVKLSKAKYYPTLAAYGNFSFSSYNTTSDIDKLKNMNTIGLNLSMPIFASGVNSAKVNQAIMKKAELQEDIMQTKDLLNINYKNALSEYQTAHDLLSVQKENLELSQKVYRQTLLQYQEGMASMADLLNVNSDFLQADNSYNQQILKCKTSEIKMYKASGNLKPWINSKK